MRPPLTEVVARLRARVVEALAAPDGARGRAPAAGADASVIVAFSGGRDSTALLDAAVAALGAGRVIAVHVHHRLQAAADAWPGHCRAQAGAIGCRCEVREAEGAPGPRESIEAWARSARYAALAEVAREVGAAALLTAHHADDQAETVLLQWLRGAGPAGLAGLAAGRPWPQAPGTRLLRPWRAEPAEAIAEYAAARGLRWVEDPMNADPRHPRVRLRREVLPLLRDLAPGALSAIGRSAALVGEAAELLEAIGREELERCRRGPGTLSRAALAAIGPARGRLALRAWMHSIGAPTPRAAVLDEWWRQLVEAHAAEPVVHHAGWRLARWRDAIVADAQPRAAACGAGLPPWLAEGVLADPREPLKTPAGRWRFEPAAAGEGGWAPLALVGRRWTSAPAPMSALLRLRADAPRRRLKLHCQALGIPPSDRRTMPGLWLDGRLACVGGLGADASADWPLAPGGVVPRWEPAAG